MAVDLKTERAPGLERGRLTAWPDARGRYGEFGGKYAPETLMPALDELEAAYAEARRDPKFQDLLDRLARDYVGRPTPLYYAHNLTEHAGGARIYLKREDLAHTGAHKINNALGQGLLAKRMGKQRIIAETGAGQHGVATATVCALLGLECIVYMGEMDIARQAPNVFRMKLLGAEVRPGILRLAHPQGRHQRSHSRLGGQRAIDLLHHRLRGGHAPLPDDGARLSIGHRERSPRAMLDAIGGLPDAVVACVGGGSNAMGIFYPFLQDTEVELVGVEAAGHGLASGKHAASLTAERLACCTGRGRTSCRTSTARCRRPTPSPPGSTTPVSAPSTPT